MNISLNWLKQYIHLDLEVNQISEYLTDIGLGDLLGELPPEILGGIESLMLILRTKYKNGL